MGERDAGNPANPQRELTDESLRIERELADAEAARKRAGSETKADAVLHLARERADEVVRVARDDADREQGPASTADEASSDRERARADDVLEVERSREDAAIKAERAERKRHMAVFLSVERDTTDRDLVGERTHADSTIAGRDEFLATVSHDLRNLLSSLSLNAELLLEFAPEGTGGEKMRKHGATAKRLVARMDRLINDLLDITSIEAGKLALRREQVEVAQLLRETLDAFAPIAAGKGITLEADAEELPRHARVDGERILQVLANLVSNAIKFTPPKGRVSIRIRAEGEQIEFAVSDTGIGIPEDALESVFQRFHRIGKDRLGLGLGLHISKCIVEAHGGHIWAESKLGTGSTLHFTVPAVGRTLAPRLSG